MSRTGLIVPIGMSAPVVTEAVAWVEGTENRVDELLMIGTTSAEVRENMILAETSLMVNRPHVRISKWELPFEDMGSDEENIIFMRETGMLIRRMRKEAGCEELHLCISGGRKTMTASAALLGQFFNLRSVFHLIHQDVATVNISFERLRQEIKELVSFPEGERMEFYSRHREKFDSVMFPPVEKIKGVELIYLPYPREMLGKILGVLDSGITEIESVREELGYPMLLDLKRTGLIEMTKKEVFPTEKGRTIASVFR